MKTVNFHLPAAKKAGFLALVMLSIAMLLTLFLYYPVLFAAGSSNGYNCTRAHIYLPTRLDFKGCRTVTGVVRRVKVEQDGDTHTQLILDKQYQGLLTPQNYARQNGALVVEDMCRVVPKDILEIPARLSCHNYRSPYPALIVGHRYEITGNYVIDDWHGSWAEIHGLIEVKQLK